MTPREANRSLIIPRALRRDTRKKGANIKKL